NVLVYLHLPAPRPVAPSVYRRFPSLEQRLGAAQPRPLLTSGDQSLLHPVTENVVEAFDLGPFVEDGLRRVAPGEEPPSPPDEAPDLDGDVALQLLHEAAHRDRRRGTHHRVKVVRGEDVGEELDLALPYSAREDAADQLVGLVAGRHEEARLDGAGGDEEDGLRVELSNGIRHGGGCGSKS